MNKMLLAALPQHIAESLRLSAQIQFQQHRKAEGFPPGAAAKPR